MAVLCCVVVAGSILREQQSIVPHVLKENGATLYGERVDRSPILIRQG